MPTKAPEILTKALKGESISAKEGLILFNKAPLAELMFVGHELRKKHVPGSRVTWQIDRNVNITNVCISGCKFCNFHCGVKSDSSFITTVAEYKVKVDEMLRYGGDQLLLQGGLHPKLGLNFYTDLFRTLKGMYPQLKIHALGPPEVAHIARLEKMTYKQVLLALIRSGLTSLPGGGAEILVDRVRKRISPGKPNSKAWTDVMAQAHKLNLLTTSTMMFGHVETPAERMDHLVKIRNLHNKRPKDTIGFKAFIAWPFMGKDTELEKKGIKYSVTPEEYLRMVAISRIMLNTIEHIQASWLTVGLDTAKLSLHAGADDFGSIMIEENVVASAGATNRIDAYGIQRAIAEAGFVPQLRNQAYQFIQLPDCDFSRILPIEELRNYNVKL